MPVCAIECLSIWKSVKEINRKNTPMHGWTRGWCPESSNWEHFRMPTFRKNCQLRFVQVLRHVMRVGRRNRKNALHKWYTLSSSHVFSHQYNTYNGYFVDNRIIYQFNQRRKCLIAVWWIHIGISIQPPSNFPLNFVHSVKQMSHTNYHVVLFLNRIFPVITPLIPDTHQMLPWLAVQSCHQEFFT